MPTELWVRRLLEIDEDQERAVVEAHPELLTPLALKLLERYAEEYRAQRGPAYGTYVMGYHALLARCRRVGIDQAFREAGYAAAEEARLYTIRPDGNPAQNLENALMLAKKAAAYLTLKHSREGWVHARMYLANVYFRRVKGDRADNIEQAIALSESVLQELRPDELPQERAVLHGNLGNYYANRVGNAPGRADVDAAMQHYQAAAEFYRRETFPEDWARQQMNIGHLFLKRPNGFSWSADDIETAIACFERALEVRTREHTPDQWASTKINLATAYARRVKGDPRANSAAAVRHARASLTVFSRDSNSLRWAQAHLSMAEATVNRWQRAEGGGAYELPLERLPAKRINQTLRHLRHALQELTPERWPSDHETAQLRMGDICFAHSRWREAHEAYAAALAIGEQLFGAAHTNIGREDAVKRQSLAYARDAFCLYRLGEIDAALAQLERGKVRLLNEWLAAPASVARSTSAGAAAAMSASGRNERDDARHAVAVILAPLITSAGGLVFVIRAGQRAVSAAAAAAPDDVGVIELPAFDTRAINAILRGNPQGLTVRFPDAEPTHGWWLLAGESEQWPEQVGAATRELGRGLMRQIVEHLRRMGVGEGATVTILPNAGLGLLPLHAALTGDDDSTHAFLDDYTASYAPSRGVLASVRQRAALAPSAASAASASSAAAAASMLAVINPTGDLAFAELEGAWVASRFSQTQMLAGDEALVQRVIELSRSARYLHFACHGTFSWADASRSGLTLAGPQTLALTDVVRRLDLRRARLVVLSACSTGQIESTDTPEEFLGLQTAFLQAGAQAVICSLWPVADISTTLLMDRFYGRHLDGMPIAAALREAQRWLRDVTAGELATYIQQRRDTAPSPRPALSAAWRRFVGSPPEQRPFAEPFYWAPFTVYGE